MTGQALTIEIERQTADEDCGKRSEDRHDRTDRTGGEERHPHRWERGVPLLEAATEGSRLRFRPVMMTSFAFILGLLPLVVATGASELARRNVGTPVFGGMILASFVGIFAIPPLYVMFQAIRERLRPSARPKEVQAKGTTDVEAKQPPAAAE